MATLFVHDHVFSCYGSEYYSEGKLTYTTWSRFLDHGEDVTVVGRVQHVFIKSKGLNISSGIGVTFSCIDKVGILDRIFPARIDCFLYDLIEKHDYIVCRLPSFLGLRAYNIAKKLRKVVLVELVGCIFDALINHGSVAGKLLAVFEYRKIRMALSKSENTIYVTNSFLQNRYPSKTEGFPISNVELVSHGYLATVNKEVTKLAFIGSLATKYKGLGDLLHAVADIKKSYPNLELHVLGGGKRDEYVKLSYKLGISRDIYFYDPIPGGAMVLKWLSQFDVYIHPSHTEGLPRSLIEAMSVGLPCVGSDVGGIPELLDSNAIFKAKDINGLSSKVQEMIDSYEIRKMMAQRNIIKSEEYEFEILREKRFKVLSVFYGS